MYQSTTQAYSHFPIVIGSTFMGKTRVGATIILMVIIIHALHGVFLV